ncbi:L-alanine exporter AlaE [Nanoarchaeota archaeon]
MKQSTLEKEAKQPSKKKIAAVDTLGNIVYSTIVGIGLDYRAGLNPAGILTSRLYGNGMNMVTGGPYGWWREKAYKLTKTKEEHSKLRKTIVDLLAFNTFQTPQYGTAVALGSLISESNIDWGYVFDSLQHTQVGIGMALDHIISEGQIDWSKVKTGMKSLATISPIIGPTMGWTIDKFRKMFGIKSAAKGAYKENK